MFIAQYRSGKDKKNVYVKLVEGVRVNGKKTIRVVKNFGRLDKLIEANGPNAYEDLKKKYEDQSQALVREIANERLAVARELLTADTPSANVSGSTPFPSLYYGHYILKRIWEDDLALHRKFDHLQKTSSKMTCSLNAVVSYLTALKVMDPRSILFSSASRDLFLGDPVKDVSLDQFYASLDFVRQNKDSLFKWINRRLDNVLGEDRATMVFYDVTNAYFEAPLTDAEAEYRQVDFVENLKCMAQEALDAGRLDDSCFDDEGEVIAEALPEWFFKEVADEKIQYLRMRGPSKEHRFDLPLVSIALVIDKNAVPMDFEVYAGNASEYKTMKQSIDKLKAKYNIKEAVVVADRGLNSVRNLKMLYDGDMGYLVAQKVSQFDADLTAKMLDMTRYKPVDPSNPKAGCYQTVNNWTKTGSAGESIKCTLVLTFNEKRQKRDLAILDAWVEIVKQKMKAGVKLGPRKTGWGALAKTSDDTEQPIIGIDEEVLRQKKALCGFAAVVYSDAKSIVESKKEESETKKSSEKNTAEAVAEPRLSGQDIADAYHSLVGIEGDFRILKTNIRLRPMYVRNSDHIRGHITICILALVLMRLLQIRLKKNKLSMSADEISAVLREAKVTAVKGSREELLYLLTGNTTNPRRGRERMDTVDIIELMQSNAAAWDKMPGVMASVGLTPLPRISGRAQLATCLKTRFPSDLDAVPAISYLRA